MTVGRSPRHFSVKFLPVGLGDPDYQELTIAAFGIVAELLPEADVVVDGYRTLYKIAKASTQLMPLGR